ncbi:MAG: allophanate hydrolase subunit 1 [Xanthomonadales bacterium]|nr:allophanate hydrolase subunit 1 [Xanthomonadales bacterium]
MRIRPCGDDALRIEPDDPGARHALAEHLRSLAVWKEVVPGRTGVTVQIDPVRHGLAQARALLEKQVDCRIPGLSEAAGKRNLTAVFGGEAGPDLAALAALNGMAPAEFVARICGAELRVDLIGFTPGFAYLDGLDPALRAARLATPRRRVAAGSIGLISGQVGLYVLPGPGGWPLVGRLCTPLFDAASAQPFKLRVGELVRLVSVQPS